MHTVSVVIPCYNSERFIQEAIDSVMDQTVLPIEIICVDDGSTDGSLLKLKDLSQRIPMLKVIAQENAGATHARNRGLEQAQGDYVQFLDADDTLLPEKLERQLAITEKNEAPDLVIGSYSKYTNKGALIYTQLQQREGPAIWLKLMRTQLGITSSILFKRGAVLAVGGWDELLKSSQEYDLMFRMIKVGAKVCLCPAIDTEVRQRNADSITASNKGENWKRYIDLRIRMREHIISKDVEVSSDEVNQVLFDSVRQLYPYDRHEALRLLRNEIPKGFRPKVSAISSAGYVKLYGLLGFDLSERLRSFIRNEAS
jgi:glycosyltransferase involved in cell wall biosynthesis